MAGSFVNAAADATGGMCLEARSLRPWPSAKCISSGRWSARPSVTRSNAAADPSPRVKIRESAALTGACWSEKRGRRIPTIRRSASSYARTIVEHSVGLDAFDDDLQTFWQVLASPFAAESKQQRRKSCLIVIVTQTQQLIQIVVFGAPEAVNLQLPCLSDLRQGLCGSCAAGYRERHDYEQRSCDREAHLLSSHFHVRAPLQSKRQLETTGRSSTASKPEAEAADSCARTHGRMRARRSRQQTRPRTERRSGGRVARPLPAG